MTDIVLISFSFRLKIATEAAQAYVKIQPPHQTIGDLVTMAFDADKELQLIGNGPICKAFIV